jgi:hypothetical protein
VRKIAESKKFERFLEIMPGVISWLFILSPFVLASFFPVVVGIFILSYAFFWLVKSLNISRHLWGGYLRLKRNSNLDWLALCKKTENLKELKRFWERQHKKDKSSYSSEDLSFVSNICKKRTVKDWKDIQHVAIFAVSKERMDIIEPSIKSVLTANYPLDKISVIIAAEERYPESLKDLKILKKKYQNKFGEFKVYIHKQKEGEIIGKGPNITHAGKEYWREHEGRVDPSSVLVTTFDADHIIHPEYFGRLSYLYVLDPNRDKKSYQPIPLLFNNIWDATPANRIAAVSSSFWQIIEGMRPFRLRTFAAHAQSLEMLLITDFWGTHTIVEDGHQYWRTYFALNGNHQMVPMFVPVYQDAVLGENLWIALKNQYLQKRRWAWGVTDVPYVIINSIKHREIPLVQRIIQTFRQFSGGFTWATSSFFLATAWIPLTFNEAFQDTVLAHNIAAFSSQMLRFAWVGLVINVWISLILMPPRPKKYGKHKYLELVVQWILSPPYAIFLSSLPALDSQTRLMFGKRLEFWITPKLRKHTPQFESVADLD